MKEKSVLKKKGGTVKDLQYWATFCPAQSRDVRRKGVDIGRKTEFCFVTESLQGGDTRADFTPLEHKSCQLLRCRCSASSRLTRTTLNTLVCSGEYTLCMSTSRLTTGQFLQLITCLQSQTSRQFELAPGAMQGEHFEVLLICFFFFCLFQKTKSTAISSIVPYIEYFVIN